MRDIGVWSRGAAVRLPAALAATMIGLLTMLLALGANDPAPFPFAKAEAEFVALALNNAIGALRAVAKTEATP